MKKHKYTSIKNVVSWVAKRVDSNAVDPSLLEDLAYEAAETIMTYESLVPKIVIFDDLSTRRIKLPCDFQYLFNIYYKPDVTSEDAYRLTTYNLSIQNNYNSVVTAEESTYPIYDPNYWNQYWVEIFPTQTNLILSLEEQTNLYNQCEGVNYLFDKEKCEFLISANSGAIALLYLAYPYDNEENLLVPDEIEVFECIKDYILRFVWETRMNATEQNSTNMYLMYHRKYLDSSKKALHKTRQMTPPELKRLARTWMNGNKNLGFALALNR